MSLENLKAKLLKEALQASSPSSQKWRTQAKQTQLVAQISSILLERHNWAPLLHTLNLASNLTPPLFNQILLRTQSNPKLSLSFFDWVKSNLKLQPDIRAHCKLARMLIQSDLHLQAKQILTSLRELESDSARVAGFLIESCKGSDCVNQVLSFSVRWYAVEGLGSEALRIFGAIRVSGCLPDVSACNALLSALVGENEVKTAWCVYSAMVRHGVSPDKLTWTTIGQILGKDKSFERLQRLLDLGVCNSVIFNLVINGLCEKGDLRGAMKVFDEMSEKKVQAGFSSYACVLDAACRFKDVEMVEMVMRLMVEKRLMSESLLMSDEVIQKVGDLGKSYAAEMLMERAGREGIELQDATYGCLIRAMSNAGRVEEAIAVYNKVVAKGVRVNDKAYLALANALCKGSRNEEMCGVLRGIIGGRAIRPKASELSSFIKLLCREGRWGEGEELLEMVMDEKSLPELDCCAYLMKHYCRTKRVNAAMALHDRVEQLNGSIDDLSSYNSLLEALFVAGRGSEAVKVFEYMRVRNMLSCDGFVVMIRWLCRGKELRMAMKYHDEMLKMGLKPDQRRYKQLISGFR